MQSRDRLILFVGSIFLLVFVLIFSYSLSQEHGKVLVKIEKDRVVSEKQAKESQVVQQVQQNQGAVNTRSNVGTQVSPQVGRNVGGIAGQNKNLISQMGPGQLPGPFTGKPSTVIFGMDKISLTPIILENAEDVAYLHPANGIGGDLSVYVVDDQWNYVENALCRLYREASGPAPRILIQKFSDNTGKCSFRDLAPAYNNKVEIFTKNGAWDLVGDGTVITGKENAVYRQVSPRPAMSSCSDPDGGNIYVKGDLGGSLDYCQSQNRVVEYRCALSSTGQALPTADPFSCPNGCIDGACIP